MKKFLRSLLFFALPFLVVFIVFNSLDVFKVFWDYDDYYENNFVSLNREWVCTQVYKKHRTEENFDAFIFGSSRSQAYKVQDWGKVLPAAAKPFHFDATGEGIYGIHQKVMYIDELGDSLKYALLVLDRSSLTKTKNRPKVLTITPPELSKESKLKFYYEFLKVGLNIRYIVSYIDYVTFGVHRAYMKSQIRKAEYPHSNNPINCNLNYGYDVHIANDSADYYKKRFKEGSFPERPRGVNEDRFKVTESEKQQLIEIKQYFDLHKTNYKLVISPMYDQIPLDKEQFALLTDIFGSEHVYNFSGKNKYTDPVHNFYDANHFRPHVAREILQIIYTSD